jgi:hypothetical protein
VYHFRVSSSLVILNSVIEGPQRLWRGDRIPFAGEFGINLSDFIQIGLGVFIHFIILDGLSKKEANFAVKQRYLLISNSRIFGLF